MDKQRERKTKTFISFSYRFMVELRDFRVNGIVKVSEGEQTTFNGTKIYVFIIE